MNWQSKYYHSYFRLVKLPLIRNRQRSLVNAIREKGSATVVFVVSSQSMWRGQLLLQLLEEDPRFRPVVVLYPFRRYDTPEAREESVKALRRCFDGKALPYLDLSSIQDPGQYLRNHIDPDIIFYPQPYQDLFGCDLDSVYFEDKLLCYIPYSFNIIAEPWPFNQRFNNIAWRLYYSTDDDQQCARQVTLNRGRNVRVVGNSLADLFLQGSFSHNWKQSLTSKKKVIWAPHFSLTEDGYLNRNSFLSIYDDMLDIARAYQDSIQFAFKPHPHLKSTLYDLPGWGQGRTDLYYRTWAEGDNTQLETDGFIDLFMTSDAMIHDCASFTAEYLYTKNPVLFLTNDVSKIETTLNGPGKAALHSHYHGKDRKDITAFLDDVVLGGNDPLEKERELFFQHTLQPQGDSSVAETIYNDLLHSLGFER